ncbi:malto-oligosyltrehalose trehalohydrolase, partial [candidate division KSB1 bacterium]|nr:malto-oligosyltrehalose trehalohydrolase [candidate division KSB1 bacterium]
MRIGAHYNDNKTCEFTVWAPLPEKVELKLKKTTERTIRMSRDRRGYWHATVKDISVHTNYTYLLNGETERPDPASFWQPHGVHQASQVVNHKKFRWTDKEWSGISLKEMIIYELHVGTFTEKGTFKEIIPRLKRLLELGVNTIEIMPVAQFPGERNWGYDGVYPFAVQNSYGDPDSLKKLVNECHKLGLAVVLDVVYNHLGPEGNYLRDFGPYFTDKYKTPWGEAVNFDDEFSDEVRNYFIENALYWFDNYHIDALRLDAIHAIFDMSAKKFLQELAERVQQFSHDNLRKHYLIAESDLNNSTVISPREMGGYGLDAQWADDFHHSVHTLLTGEEAGYYQDFGETGHLIKALENAVVYTGQYSEYRKRSHGNSYRDQHASQFVVAIQNHDQVGNRMMGERLSHLISFEGLKLAAGVLLLSPYIPLIFMGEEYGESSPFLYFVSHGDPNLIKAVREGRKSEFKSFRWKG